MRLPFELDPQIIHHIIYSQAGSIGKAVIELLMNSVDANATTVHLTMTREGFECQDDGQGFVSRDDVLRYFGRFGTPHTEGDATYGRFRLGRGQIMAHASTLWTSNRWQMFVDTRTMGYGYDLDELEAAAVGCGIKGTWYEPLSDVELMSAVQEVRDLVKYTPISVVLNGRVITRDPRTEKWDFEDEFAYYRVKEEGAVSIYNLGVLVRHDSSHLWGAGGLVVTKKAIGLNVSRTEILRKTCPVWKSVAARLTKLASSLTIRLGDHRKTEARREKSARSLLAGEEGLLDLFEKEEIITLLPGKKHVTLEDFLDKCKWNRQKRKWQDPQFAVVQSGHDVPKAEAIAQEGLAVLVHPQTLERFGCYNGLDFVDCLERIVEHVKAAAELSAKYQWRLQQPDPWIFVPTLLNFDTLRDAFQERTQVMSEKELDRETRRVWTSLRCVLVHYARLCTGGRKFRDGQVRGGLAFVFLVGTSNAAEAWTDGKSYIAIDERIVRQLKATPMKTASRIFSIVEHELSHEGDSLDCGHDEAFYQRFHNLTIKYSEERQRYLHMFVAKYTRSLEMEGKHGRQNEVWRSRYLTDRAGNGRVKKGLSRAIEDVSADPVLSEPVAEESMALISVVNAHLVEGGYSPPPGNWAEVLRDALQAQKDLWTAQQEEREHLKRLGQEADEMEAERAAEQEAIDAEDRQRIAALLDIDAAEIDEVALSELRWLSTDTPEQIECLRQDWLNKSWEHPFDEEAYDQMLAEWAAEEAADEEKHVDDDSIAHDVRNFYPENLATHIQPGETQWMLERNAAIAGFHDVASYLMWRSENAVDA
jgi:hypothetical protein